MNAREECQRRMPEKNAMNDECQKCHECQAKAPLHRLAFLAFFSGIRGILLWHSSLAFVAFFSGILH